MSENTIALYTAEEIADLRHAGTTGSWRANSRRAGRCRYVLLHRNGHRTHDGVPNGESFLIVRGLSVVPSQYPGRRDIRFAEFAVVSGPDSRRGQRNPVGYGELNDLLPGINPNVLHWQRA